MSLFFVPVPFDSYILTLDFVLHKIKEKEVFFTKIAHLEIVNEQNRCAITCQGYGATILFIYNLFKICMSSNQIFICLSSLISQCHDHCIIYKPA